MPAPGHTQKTLERAAEKVNDLYGPDGKVNVRVSECLRCQQPINGWGFHTLYGSLTRPNGTVVHSCGEFVHHRCPPPHKGKREVWHDVSLDGTPVPRSRQGKRVAVEIFLQPNGRYAARVGKQRLGTHATLDLAEQARERYLAKLKTSKEKHGRKTRTRV